MKNLLLSLTYLITCNVLFSQSILNVNNTSSGVTTQHTTLAAAVAAAAEGDIIYLYPSSISYGPATINKKLTIIGPGYLVAQNPSLEINTYVSNGVIDDISFVSGSNGTLITGVDFNNLSLNGQANIAIVRCKVRQRLIFLNTNNILVEGCYFEWQSNGWANNLDNFCNLNANTNNNNLIVRNNIFHAFDNYSGGCGTNCYYLDNLNIGSSSNAIVENNIFRDRTHYSNSIVKNNIYLQTTQTSCCANAPIANNNAGNSFQNNILVANQTGLGSTNIINVAEATIFEGWPTQGNRSYDDRYILKSGSPAIGAGIGGIDCGVFAGPTPYKLSGIPFVPLIYQVNAPTTGNAATGINVNVKIRANN
jgi:hypothetical protein